MVMARRSRLPMTRRLSRRRMRLAEILVPQRQLSSVILSKALFFFCLDSECLTRETQSGLLSLFCPVSLSWTLSELKPWNFLYYWFWGPFQTVLPMENCIVSTFYDRTPDVMFDCYKCNLKFKSWYNVSLTTKTYIKKDSLVWKNCIKNIVWHMNIYNSKC